MPTIHAEASTDINATPQAVYNIIADYQNSHPLILPKENFSDLKVEKGGFGDGTVITFTTTMAGQSRKFRAVITEPEPGRVLVETDEAAGTVTTFTITPVDEGRRSNVLITTDFASSGGLRGFVERLASPGMLRGVYKKELANLTRLATSNSISPAQA